jgi:hypothetical protein
MNNTFYLKSIYNDLDDLELAKKLLELSQLKKDCFIDKYTKTLTTRINIIIQIMKDRGIY